MGAAPSLGSMEWGECVVPLSPVDPALRADVRRTIGAAPDWLPRLAPCPWLVRAVSAIVARPLAYVSPALCDLIGLVVSQDNSCRYCYGIQRTMLGIMGYSDEYLDRVLRDFHVADLSPGERAALNFARRLTRANPLPGRAEFEAVVAAGLPRRVVTEVVVTTASDAMANRMATLLALPPESIESTARHPLFRLMRPLIAWRMRPRLRSPLPPPDPNVGLGARLVTALGDLPSAHTVRRIVDEAWASDILPRRTKTLMLIVIGRAIGCGFVEEEAGAMLVDEGFTPADIEQVLATLASPRLDARERRLVPFARETVRYQSATIQRRARELCRDLTPAETLEMVGVVSFANALCRLGVVLEAC